MTTTITTDYVLPDGQVITAVDQAGVSIEGAAWRAVTLGGDVVVTAERDVGVAGVRAEAFEDQVAALWLTPNAAVSVDTTSLNLALGVGAAGDRLKLTNEGAITVHAAGEALGATAGRGGFVNHGTLTVEAVGNAAGVTMDRGGSFENSGTISVVGGSLPFSGATGVRLGQPNLSLEFVNSGTIKATQLGSAHSSIGVAVAGYIKLTNHGLIEADNALWFSRDGIESKDGRIADITNTGTLRGAVHLDNETTEPVILRNSGMIDGAVTLNNGADTYSGEAGLVTGVVHGGAGADVLRGGAGPETLSGDAGSDTIDGGAGADVVNGGQGDDRIDGGLGANRLRGEEGNDVVIGGADFDDINGNTGDDTVSGGAGADWVLGGQGNDRVLGDVGDDILNGNLGDDTCSGGEGADSVRGGQGADVLFGDAGADHLYGDRGDDSLSGGDGADVFHIGAGGGHDRVLDFSSYQGDRVQIDGGVAYTVAQSGGDTVVTLSTGDELILVGVQRTTLPENWIITS